MDLLLLHFVFLVWLSVAAALRWADHPADRFLAALALGWANLVATSLALSPLGRLGEPGWLFGVSIGLAALTALAARRFPLTPATAPAPAGETTDLTFQAVALTTLAALGLASAWAAGHYAPIDSLSVTSTVPRALLHVGEGNLLPLPSADARRVVLPFNHGLIHTVALGYQPTLVTLNFVNLLSWVAAGLAVHRLSRQIGAGPSRPPPPRPVSPRRPRSSPPRVSRSTHSAGTTPAPPPWLDSSPGSPPAAAWAHCCSSSSPCLSLSPPACAPA
jgi:hypothetical protein